MDFVPVLDFSCVLMRVKDEQREKITRHTTMPANELKTQDRNHCQKRTPFLVFWTSQILKNQKSAQSTIDSDAEMKFAAHLSEVNDLYEWNFLVFWFMKTEQIFFVVIETVQLQYKFSTHYSTACPTSFRIWDFIHFIDVHKSSRKVFLAYYKAVGK